MDNLFMPSQPAPNELTKRQTWLAVQKLGRKSVNTQRRKPKINLGSRKEAHETAQASLNFPSDNKSDLYVCVEHYANEPPESSATEVTSIYHEAQLPSDDAVRRPEQIKNNASAVVSQTL